MDIGNMCVEWVDKRPKYSMGCEHTAPCVPTCAFGRARAHVVRHDAAAGHVVPLHVNHQEVVPLPVGKMETVSIRSSGMSKFSGWPRSPGHQTTYIFLLYFADLLWVAVPVTFL